MDKKTKETLKGIYEGLTDEQKEKAKACRSTDELMELAGEWGLELPDEVLDSVAGGEWGMQPMGGEGEDQPHCDSFNPRDYMCF